MDPQLRPRFFIYDRKEIIVLVLLGILVAMFAFTLGIHFGKRLGGGLPTALTGESPLVDTAEDHIPNRQELDEQRKYAERAADELLNKDLHEEVAKTGIRLDDPRQTRLPKQTVSPEAGKTTLPTEKDNPGEKNVDGAPVDRLQRAARGLYTLQIGSYQVRDDADKRAGELEAVGMKPFLREVDLKQKGKWYRVYIGGYKSADEAEVAGKKFKNQHVINSYVVSKMPRG